MYVYFPNKLCVVDPEVGEITVYIPAGATTDYSSNPNVPSNVVVYSYGKTYRIN